MIRIVQLEAPSALAAALASSAAQPDSPRGRPHPARPEAPRRVRQSPAKSPPKPRTRWRTLPRLRPRRYRWQEPLRGASRPQKPRATGPPWGRGASALDPSVTRSAVWSRLRRRSIHSADRLPHGALAISAHLRRAAIFDGDPITTMPRPNTNGTSQAVTSESSCGLLRCDDPSVTLLVRLTVTIRSAHCAVTIRPSPAQSQS